MLFLKNLPFRKANDEVIRAPQVHPENVRHRNTNNSGDGSRYWLPALRHDGATLLCGSAQIQHAKNLSSAQHPSLDLPGFETQEQLVVGNGDEACSQPATVATHPLMDDPPVWSRNPADDSTVHVR